MEQGHFAFEISLGKEKMIARISKKFHLQKNVWNTDRHSNANWELHMILKGKCRVDVEDLHHDLHSTNAILIAPGRHHRPQQHPGEFEHFSFSLSIPQGRLHNNLSAQISDSLCFSATEEMLQTARFLIRENASEADFQKEMTQVLITQFVIQLFRHLKLNDEAENETQTSLTQDQTALIDDYFEKHFADQSGEEELAKQLHLSRRQLVRILQEHYGMNFRQKLIRARMDYAAWLLRSTDYKVSRISECVGYRSEAAFFQVFRKNFGITPQKYRTMKKKGK